MLKQKLKESFPALYRWYQHLQRRVRILHINQRKKLTEEQYEQELSRQFLQSVGYELDWNNLNTFTEKMQWAKIHDKDPLKPLLTDKYQVREWVAEKIGPEYLIGLLGVWDRFEDIDFSKLPNRFVLKATHGCKSNIIVKDKLAFDVKDAKQKFHDWFDMDFGFKYLELHYSKIRPRIVAEEFIETEMNDLQDYKFLCFGGQPKFCWVDMDRSSNHTRNVYDLNWELQPWTQGTLAHYEKPIEKPKNFDKMIEIATKLSEGFSHVRVDLYNVNGKIYFGEMTFTGGGGIEPLYPAEYDREVGALWELPRSK